MTPLLCTGNSTLRKIGKIIKAKRMAVYSPLDGQPCADHDRASGEGVGPQEYVLIKMAVYDDCLVGDLAALAGKKVFLAAATLRWGLLARLSLLGRTFRHQTCVGFGFDFVVSSSFNGPTLVSRV